MSFIFLDESGDLGFDFSKPKTSNFFVITFMFVAEKRPIEKIVKKVFRFDKKVASRGGVLHCFKETPRTRYKLLSDLNEKKISIIAIYLNKRKVYTHLTDEKQVLYNYVTNILLDRLISKKILPLDQDIHLIASQRETNKFLNQNFKNYLEAQGRQSHRIKLTVDVRSPNQEKCLQVVDFVCWAIFRRREMGDESYYNLIKSKIVEENPLFP